MTKKNVTTDGATERRTRTMAEAAKIIGVSYLTVHRLAKRKLLRPLPGMRHKIFTEDEINRFLSGSAV